MTLKEFATTCGVTADRCHRSWGGTWAYVTADSPLSHYCGYKSEAEAYKAWAMDTFGECVARAIFVLIKNQRG